MYGPDTTGGRCQNYYDTCPIPSHRSGRATESDASSHAVKPAMAANAIDDPDGRMREPLTDTPDHFEELVERASAHYEIDPRLITSDYWLIRTLHAWASSVGDGYVQRRYPDPKLSDVDNRVGRFVFGGGTALSAAWGITQRWSEDIDLTLSETVQAQPRQLRQACTQAFDLAARMIPSAFNITEQSDEHCFASFLRNRQTVARIDVTFSSILDMEPTWTQQEQVMSMIGRLCDEDVLRAHPELGGFEMRTLGPGSTSMDKLLAQTKTAGSGDMGRIKERARDVYDLACIAREKWRFEGHIGRDSKALLHIAEAKTDDNDKRPADGFASLRSFDPSTPEHEALADGYEEVINGMVWGEKIPLDEAIRLAVSLDPGPAEPYALPPPHPQAAYPHR